MSKLLCTLYSMHITLGDYILSAIHLYSIKKIEPKKLYEFIYITNKICLLSEYPLHQVESIVIQIRKLLCPQQE